ncbi:Protein APA1 [Colletotrichum orbiculare MAFF 240422]|uniref:Protein APA1 n=1 Tax=Colletotrichum orbiculare (strain 104-T / ATCC 96160 / CBS 514.97 / LARS 414 / MAFF 240422) TaxID=1213857 RepID=N4V9J4_COLOR|nr:Protein APA1 [Colletotrichum orbiculare MAFF 240422]
MGSTTPTEASLLEKFDESVKAGTVLYTPDLKTIHHDDGGFKFEFRLTAALKTKPAAVQDNAELDSRPPTPGNHTAPPKSPQQNAQHLELDEEGRLPGGDISIKQFIVQLVNDTHVLAFNKFCVYRPHLLLLAADGHRRQFEALSRDDFAAATDVLRGLAGGEQEYFVIFNGGKAGGCSRLHKHMQIMPKPADVAVWPDDENLERAVPYRYFVYRFEDTPGPEELVEEYKRMLKQAAAVVPGREEVVEEDEDGRGVVVPHNVVLGARWMVVVPRVKAGVDGADANAAGMLGMVWASGEEVTSKWFEMGPRWILGEVGVRK